MNRDKNCPIQSALDILGGKWKLAIIHALMRKSPMRFKEIEREVKGITPRMLIKELKELDTHGLLSRTHHPTIPPTVEYDLTDKGQTVIPLVKELKKWGKKHITGKPPEAQDEKSGTRAGNSIKQLGTERATELNETVDVQKKEQKVPEVPNGQQSRDDLAGYPEADENKEPDVPPNQISLF